MQPIIHKIVFIGDCSVGKTAIINQYIYSSSSSDYKPTIGIDFFTKNLQVEGSPVRLLIWDTAGQEKFHSLIPSYLHNSSIAILVFDITVQESFENIKKWHKIVLDAADPVLFLVGNKVDLEDERKVQYNEAKKYADEIKAKYIETSAKTPMNIDVLFNEVARVPSTQPNEPVPLDEKQQTITVKVDLNAPKQNDNNSANSQNGCGC